MGPSEILVAYEVQHLTQPFDTLWYPLLRDHMTLGSYLSHTKQPVLI